MRILIAAIAALVLSAIQWLAPAAVPPALIEFARNVVPLLLAYIIADSIVGLRGGKTAAPPVEAPAAPRAPAKEESSQPGEALVLLSLLQEKGRFVDYLMEDITSFGDAQVAAASRVVHQGCAAVIREFLDVTPVHPARRETGLRSTNRPIPASIGSPARSPAKRRIAASCCIAGGRPRN